MVTFGHNSDNRFIQMSVYQERFQLKCLCYPKFSPPSYVPPEGVTTTVTASMFHLTMCCISMNNRCVEHVLEDNKWTVLVLIVSDDIGILGNSHMGIRAQQHHEHRSFHTKLLRHLKLFLSVEKWSTDL